MRFSIKFKLTAIILLIFVPLFFFTIHHYYKMLEHEKRDIKTGNLFIATHIANDIDNLIEASFATLRPLSRHPAVINKDSRACDRLFSGLLPSYPVHLNIVAAGMDGYNYGSGVPSPDVRKLNYNDKDWFVRARRGSPVVGDMHISKLFKKPSVMVAMPVRTEADRQVGVIGMSLNLSAVRAVAMKSLPPYEGSVVTIVDSQNNILSCSCETRSTEACEKVPPLIMKTRERDSGSLEERGEDGIERLYSFAALSKAGWRVIVGVPREHAYYPAYAFGKNYVMVLSFVSVTAIALSFLVSRKLTNNISSLIAGLKEIERGNLSATLKLSGRDELQEVASSFNRMAAGRRESEQKLKESESFRTAVLNGIGEGVVVIGKDYRVLSANQGYCDQVKMPCDAIIGKHCFEISHHIDQPCFEKAGGCDCTVQKCFATGERHRSMHTHFDKDGNPRYLETNAYPLKDSSGAIIAAIETLMDVTNIIVLEESLEKSKEQYRKLYDDAPDMMHSIDKNGKIIICNRTEAQALGYEIEEIAGRPQKDIIVPEDWAVCESKMKLLKTSGFFEGELNLLAKDGKRIPVFVRSKAIYDQDGVFLMSDAVLRDITEKKALEAQLLQAQKMEAVGLLAGGVAHDFNNVITAVVGYGNLLLMETLDVTAHGYVEQILAATERATGLTQGLLAFSRKQIINPKPVRLSDVIGHLGKILAKVIGEDIELRVFLSPHEAAVMADAGQIDQVLMNLATNARDAMPEGGALIIETELLKFDEDYVQRHAFAKPGRYMLVSVTDTGLGIDANHKGKIFEPFFTTKDTGKGTGLGLAMVYGIVKQHNGYINVYSEQGKGTTFKIYLPVIEQDAEKFEDAPVLQPVRGGSETLLIAEDAAMVRDLTKKILEEFGYSVVTAENGEDAVEKYKSNPDVDLLILDVVMPGKNGKETYAEIKRLRPDIKALFTSGYTANIIHKKGILDSGTEFISKPFSPNAFLRKVREVLDKKPGAV